MSPAVLTLLYFCVTWKLADSSTYHVVLQHMNITNLPATIKLACSSAIDSANITAISPCGELAFFTTEPKIIDRSYNCSVSNETVHAPIKVESDSAFNLHVFVAYPSPHNSEYEGYQAIRDDDLGDTYYIVTYCSLGGLCQFAVTAIRNNTLVKVTFPATIGSNSAIHCLPDTVGIGNPITLNITLNEFEILHCESKQDLTGTYVSADAPVAVFAGTRDIPDVRNSMTSTAYMFDQMIPISRWGTRHYMVPNDNNEIGDLIKIITREEATSIKISGYSPFVIPDAGESIVRRIDWGSASMIDSSYPVMIAQFSGINLYNTNDTINSISRPSMLLLQDYEHWTSSFLVTCPSPGNDDKVAVFTSSEYLSHVIVENDVEWDKSVSGDIYSLNTNPNLNVMMKMGTVSWKNNLSTGRVSIPNTTVGVYVFCESGGIYAAGRDLSTTTEGCIRRTKPVSFPGDGIDNDCDGKVDSVQCTDANRQLNFASTLTNATATVLELSPVGIELISFTVETCGSAEIALKSTSDDVYVHIGFTNTHVQVDASSQRSECIAQAIPNICDTVATISISWFLDESNSSQRHLQVHNETDEIHSQLVTDARYDKMFFSSQIYPANYTIDVMTQDCAKIMSGDSLDSFGTRFIIPVEATTNYTIYITPASIVTLTTNDGDILKNPERNSIVYSDDIRVDDTIDWIILTTSTEVSVYLHVHDVGGMHIIPTDVLGPTYLVPSISIWGSNSVTAACKIYPVGPQVTTLPDDTVGYGNSNFAGIDPLEYEYRRSNSDFIEMMHGSNTSANPGTDVREAGLKSRCYTRPTDLWLNDYVRLGIVCSDNATPMSEKSDTHLHGLQPIAVFCSASANKLPRVQIPPLESLGELFYIPAMRFSEIREQETINRYIAAYVHITTAEDSTYLTIVGDYHEEHTIDWTGQALKRTIIGNQNYTIESSKPVLVTLTLIFDGNTVSHTIVPPVQQYKTTHRVPNFKMKYMKLLGSFGVTNASEDVTSNVTTDAFGKIIYYDSPTFTISVFRTRNVYNLLVLLSDVTYEHKNKTCQISYGKYNDTVDNDCDGLVDEEVCDVIVAGKIDCDIDGSINEDCGSHTESYKVNPSHLSSKSNPDSTTSPKSASPTASSFVPRPETEPTVTPPTEPTVTPPMKASSAPTLPPIKDTRAIIIATTTPPPGSTAATEETCRTDCLCPCGWTKVNNLTQTEIKEEVVKIQTRLRMNKHVLSSAVRKRTSASDPRTSATAVGYAGLGFLVITITSVVLLDLMSLISHLRMFRDNVRQIFNV